MQLTSAPAIIKEVEYDRTTKDYAAFVTVDGSPRQCIGYGKTHSQADDLCNEYAYHYYADNATPEVAAAIAVEMFEPTSSEDEPSELPTCHCGALAVWEVRDGLLLTLVCEECYQAGFVNNDLLWSAWEANRLPALACPACQGRHHIQQCPAIGQLLMRPEGEPCHSDVVAALVGWPESPVAVLA